MHDEEPNQERTLPYSIVKRIATLSLVFGLIGGVVGGVAFVRFAPSAIPVDKKQVVLQESSATVDVSKKVAPSVVSITSQTSVRGFFGASQTQQGAGTGIIVSSDGLIMTNKHVVPSDASTFSVFTSDGKEYKNATVVARDPQNDLAFVRIKASGLKSAELGDSGSVEVGQKVIAIGNALGQFQNTVTEGVISGLGRPVVAGDQQGGAEEQLQNLFQTDAAINPGNSGGPLVNLSGQVIGINTAVAGEAQNIGFAIPINEAKSALASVKSGGKITRAYLGVRYIPITKDFASQNNLSVDDGAYVAGDNNNPAVVPNSPAAKAGIQDGDIITKINNDKIDQTHNLSSLIGKYKSGDKITVTLIRDGKEQTLNVTLEESSGQ
jgi:serine protease Do